MQPIREALIILPQQTNDGHSLAGLIDELRDDLAETFGGVTVTTACGSWKQSNGHVKTEPVTQFTIAYAVDEASNVKLISIARVYGARAEQEVVYVRTADGSVNFVEPHVTLVA